MKEGVMDKKGKEKKVEESHNERKQKKRGGGLKEKNLSLECGS